MTKTIQTALAPLMIIGSFCSLALIEYPIGQPRPYFTCLYLLITWSLFVYFFYYLFDYIPFPYTSWPNNIVMITTIVSMIVSLFRFKELKMCLRKLSIVDDTLEILGTPKKYRQLRNRIIQMIIGWILLSFLINAFDYFWWNFNFSIARLCALFLGNHSFHVNNLSALTWAVILRYTSSRFQQVNEYICVLYSDLLKDNANCRRQNRFTLISQRRTEAEKCKQYMWIIMHVHLQLCLISCELNKIFCIQMILQMTFYFAYIIELCREIYTIYMHKDITIYGQVLESVVTYIYGILYSIILIALNYICQIVCYKANETIAILYKVSNNNSDDNLREQILQFILQIKQKEVKFGMGLFYFGYDFIRRFYKSIMTVLVILIQMRPSYENILPN